MRCTVRTLLYAFTEIYNSSTIKKCTDRTYQMLSGRDQNVDDVTTSFQSDAEKLEGLPVVDFMDREKVTKSKSQIGFIKFVLLPLFEALGRLYPSVVVSCISDATQTVRVFSMVLCMCFWCLWFSGCYCGSRAKCVPVLREHGE